MQQLSSRLQPLWVGLQPASHTQGRAIAVPAESGLGQAAVSTATRQPYAAQASLSHSRQASETQDEQAGMLAQQQSASG